MRFSILLVSAFMLFSLGFAQAVTISVPGDYATIQEGIDAADPGDTVLVAEGLYFESFDFKGKAITVQGQTPELTVIHGMTDGTLAVFVSGEGPDSVLDGMTFRKGVGTQIGKDKMGGAIRCKGASPTIRNCRFIQNEADLGGAIYCFESKARILQNYFESNYSVWGAVFCDRSSPDIKLNSFFENDDGAIYLAGTSDPLIDQNLFIGDENNTIVYVGRYAAPVIIGNRFIGNSETRNEAIECRGSDDPDLIISIIGNTFIDSTATMHEGVICGGKSRYRIIDNYFSGMHTLLRCENSPTVHCCNNVFVDNGVDFDQDIVFDGHCSVFFANNTVVRPANGSDRAIRLQGGARVEITNTIVWGETPGSDDLIEISDLDGPSTLKISHSNLEGGRDSVWIAPTSTLIWGDGMIDADPLFVDEMGGDFHLTYTSPCRDAGNNAAVMQSFDFEGDPRIAWNGTVDMGADEFYTHLYVTGDKTTGGLIEAKLIGLPGTSPTGIFIGSGVLTAPMPTAWGSFWLEAPWVLVQSAPIPAEGVLSIPAMIPLSPPAPYDIPMQALIGLDPDSLSNLEVLQVR